MPETLELRSPWLVAVWPGMGHVALNAGYYLMAKLGMELIAELEAGDLFDVDHVEVKRGLIQPGRRPRNRFFVYSDPNELHDVVLFLGEAQPPIGKYPFCKQLVSYVQKLGVERVFTFAAMATPMRPEDRSRVFGAATDADNLDELKRLGLDVHEEGHIGGLNGVLLGVAMEAGLPGACLLGEMPHVFARLPFPKASQAVLEVFTEMAGIELDFTELSEQARTTEEQLGELMARVEGTFSEGDEGGELEAEGDEEEEGVSADLPDDPGPDAVDRRRIEALFGQAKRNRSKAFELKRELDRLGAFKEYEDRFLDLFKKPPE